MTIFQSAEALQTLIAVAVLALMGWAVLRTGQSNPVGTRQLGEQLEKKLSPIRHKQNNFDMKMAGVEAKLEHVATTASVEDLERDVHGRLATMEERMRHSATREDVARIAGSVERLDAKVEGVEAKLKGVDEGVVRIEQFLMNGGRK